MTMQTYKRFTGTASGQTHRDYIISERDALLVDLAIRLGRPLLIEGEAGCGKTTLASAVARELGLDDPIIVPIRSSSRSNDLFYRYDAMVRLQESSTNPEKAAAVQNYITLEPVGRAIVEGKPRLILIDEIDKADMDFQNDLLFALERFEFVIDEIPASETERINGLQHRMKWSGGLKPIIMFTSNQEKLLPKPFLRRCLYLELKFPADPARLVEIVEANLRTRHERSEPGAEVLETLSRQLIDRAVASFVRIRDMAERDGAIKKPATAELVDWVHALHIHPDKTSDLGGLTPPMWEVLFRTSQDKARHALHESQATAQPEGGAKA